MPFQNAAKQGISGARRNFTFNRPNDTIKNDAGMQADVAQLVEQLIRNQQVVSSSLTVGSRIRIAAWPLVSERSFLLRLRLHVHRNAGGHKIL